MEDMALLREQATRHSEAAFEELVRRRTGLSNSNEFIDVLVVAKRKQTI